MMMLCIYTKNTHYFNVYAISSSPSLCSATHPSHTLHELPFSLHFPCGFVRQAPF